MASKLRFSIHLGTKLSLFVMNVVNWLDNNGDNQLDGDAWLRL